MNFLKMRVLEASSLPNFLLNVEPQTLLPKPPCPRVRPARRAEGPSQDRPTSAWSLPGLVNHIHKWSM